MRLLKEIKANLITSSIVYIVLGAIMIILPGFVNDFFSTIIGLVILIFGVAELASYVSIRSYVPSAKYTLFFGLSLSLFGIYVLLNPNFISSIIPVISGILIIVDAINKLKQTSELKQAKYDKWWVNLIISIVLLIFGCILTKNPFGTVNLMIRIFGAVLLVDGLYDLLTTNVYSNKIKKVVKTIK